MSLDVQSAHASPQVGGLASGAPPARIAGVSTSLLPEPGAGGLSGTEDALSMLYDLVAKQGEMTQALGQVSVANSEREQQTQLSQEKAAEQAQAQAEADSGGFWHDICSVFEDIGKALGVVAAAAATVFTCGTAGIAAVAVAAVMISAGAVVSATKCLGKDSAFFGMGMEVVGSIVTMGAASSAVATSVLGQVAQGVNAAATIAGGACDVMTGVSSIEVGKFESESEDDAADVQQALNQINQQSRMMNEVIDGLKSAQESNKNALQLVAGAAQTYGQTSVIAASGGKA
jgi:hypothetical protein